MNKLNSIQFLRGFAAVFVVAFHFRVALNDVYAQTNLGDLLFSNGAFGVDLFFVISGFIIHYSTMR
ncbi:acyltransferase family protein, partial [Citrobacter freundii]